MAPLRPAHEVYHRLRWGGDVDLDQVEVEILDRVRGTQCLPFVAFDPRGPIPFSRVMAFRIGGQVVWDRAARIDRILGSGVTSGERFAPRVVEHRPLRVLTYNVLFDRYDPEVVRTSERLDGLFTTIRDADADLVALQEVQRPFLRTLLAQDWVREAYASTDDGSGHSVQPYGQLLLSKWPLTDVRVIRLEGDKRHLAATVWMPGASETRAGTPVRVVVVHLSSDRHEDAPERRTQQLAVLADHIPADGGVLVLGDFNQQEPVDLELEDVWTSLRPNDPGFTFDPERNALARVQSVTGQRKRLDRILQRGFEPLTVELVGVDASELPPSDHHGVLASMRPANGVPATAGSPMHAALVLPLPADVAAHLEPWRRRFDPNRWRWPPHITLFHGPVDPRGLHRFVHDMRAVSEGISSVPIALGDVDVWRQRQRALVVARTDERTTGAVRELRAALPAGPWAADSRPLQPHVTVARLPWEDRALVEALRARLSDALPLAWTVERLEVWAREDAGPMTPHARVELGGGRPWTPPSLAAALKLVGASGADGVDASHADLVRRIGEHLTVQVVGSRAVGAHLPESDLDLSVRHPDPTRARTQLARLIGGRPVDGEVPTLRVRHPPTGLSDWVDVAFLTPEVPGPEAEWAAIRDAGGQGEGFRQVLRLVRAWASARQVHDPAWGFPGGLACAIAVACTAGPGSTEDWVCRVLERLLGEEPLFIGPEPPPEGLVDGGLRPEIWTSAGPRRAVVRQILPCTSRVLRDELERALLLAWDGRWDLALQPLMTVGGPVLWLNMEAGTQQSLDQVVGWARGRARSLLAALSGSTSQHTPRPWPRLLPMVRRRGSARVGCRFGVGIEGIPSGEVQAAIAHLGARWLHETDRPADGVLRFDTVPG